MDSKSIISQVRKSWKPPVFRPQDPTPAALLLSLLDNPGASFPACHCLSSWNSNRIKCRTSHGADEPRSFFDTAAWCFIPLSLATQSLCPSFTEPGRLRGKGFPGQATNTGELLEVGRDVARCTALAPTSYSVLSGIHGPWLIETPMSITPSCP